MLEDGVRALDRVTFLAEALRSRKVGVGRREEMDVGTPGSSRYVGKHNVA